MVQLIDVSDKILYNEVKAEQEFLALINVAISHHLRNPLNALIGEAVNIQNITAGLKSLGHNVKQESQRQFYKHLSSLEQCHSRVDSATKTIDLFISDMIDYTNLQNGVDLAT